MSMLSKLRCITVDVTGTLMAYKGELGDYYCMAAKSIGLPCPDYKRVHEGFKLAYTEMARKHPCFGFSEKISNIVWWKTCVRNSFVQAGYEYDEETFEKIFRRIYSTFGSSAPYTIFPDSQPFLSWVRRKGITVGIISNAEYRYQDVILPALGLHQGSEWDFGVFSGLEGVEKPDPRMYQIALERAGNIVPKEALHVGDSMRKDYLPAKSLGMHALLLDRFKIPDAEIWRKSGAVVLPDLVAVQNWLSSEEQTPNGPINVADYIHKLQRRHENRWSYHRNRLLGGRSKMFKKALYGLILNTPEASKDLAMLDIRVRSVHGGSRNIITWNDHFSRGDPDPYTDLDQGPDEGTDMQQSASDPHPGSVQVLSKRAEYARTYIRTCAQVPCSYSPTVQNFGIFHIFRVLDN